MDERKRILYLTFDFLEPIFSGNGTLSRIQVFGFLERGFDVMVLCPDNKDIDPQVTKWMELSSLKIIRIPIESNKVLSPSCDWRGFYSKGIIRIEEIREFNPDMIVNPDWHAIDLAIRFKTEFSIPLVSQFFRIFSYFKEYVQNEEDYTRVRKKEIELVSQSDLIITLSSFDKQWCLDHGGKNVQTIYPPLTDAFIQSLNSTVPDGISDIIQLITVSRIVPEKKISRILPILKKLDNMGVKFSYTVIGESLDRQYGKRVLDMIEKLNLHSKIRILGRIPLKEMISHLRTHPIYIHTSYYEPFGITIIEAAAAGCKIVLDQDGLIGAKEWLSLHSDQEKMIPIDYSDLKSAAITLHTLIKSISKDEKRKIDSRIVSKLNSKQYMETLVNLFRDFL